MKTMRKSNLELLRILAMFLIVLYHVIMHGKIINNCTNRGLSTIFTFLEYTTVIHVNLFVLLTGYFQSQSKFKQSKLWQINNSCLFYRILIVVIFSFFGLISLTKLELSKEIFIINLTQYWFIKYYMYLYCLSPFINKMINNMDKALYRKLILVSIILFSIIPYITGLEAFYNDGYSLYNFIFLYLIGGYLRKYPLEENYIFKKMSINLIRCLLLVIFIACPTINLLITKTSESLLGINTLFDQIANNFLSLSLAYSNPIVLIQTISLFLLFNTFDIKSKLINGISSLTMGVYLIHDNNFVREVIYKFTKIDNGPIDSYLFILYAILIAILIFVCCAIIEWIRQLIFKFIYNRKISEKIRTKYYNFLNSMYIKAQ